MSEFKNYFLQINRVKIPEKLTELEKKHVPILTIPPQIRAGQAFELEVTVGTIQHPIENDHHIQYLDFFIGEVYLTRLTFTPVVMLPRASLTIILKESGLLRAVSRCNLHGQWEGTVELKIAEEAPPEEE